MTTTLGVVLGRSRTALTIIRRKKLFSGSASSSDNAKIDLSSKTFLLPHRNLRFEELPDSLLNDLKEHLSDACKAAEFCHSALLSCAPSRISEKNIDEIRLHAIIQHELRKQLPNSPLEVSIQQVRQSLGSVSTRSSDARRDLIQRFKLSGTVFDDPQTVSGLQILSESWGVAQYLNKKIMLDELKSGSPDLVSKLRSELLNKKKLFSSSAGSDAVVINELLDQEVDKILVKRFQT